MKPSKERLKYKEIVNHRRQEDDKALDNVFQLIKLPSVSPDTTYRVLSRAKARHDKLKHVLK